jgi:glutathione synthase/RimK-type ligase-like ATP-grasp enzyme
MATFALAGPVLADDVRVATAEEQLRVTDALAKAGYTMPETIRVDNDKFKAYAKSKDGKDVEVTLDLNSLKVLSVEKKK